MIKLSSWRCLLGASLRRRGAAISIRGYSNPAPCPEAETRSAVDHGTLKEFSDMPGYRSIIMMSVDSFKQTRSSGEKDFDLNTFLKGCFERFGPAFVLPYPQLGINGKVFFTKDPDDVETIYRSTMHNPVREGMHSLGKVRNEHPKNYFKGHTGLLPTNGEEWWEMRKRVQGPLLRPNNVAMYLPKVDAATQKFVARMGELVDGDNKLPGNFIEQLYKWSFECVGIVALDHEFGCLEEVHLAEDSPPARMIHLVNEMMEAFGKTEMEMQWWRFFRTKDYVRLETAHNAFLEIADKFITEAEEKIRREEGMESNPTVLETFLNTEGLSRIQVATMILDMLFAGVDTTSYTVSFALYNLARNPEKQKILQKEIDSVVDNDGPLTMKQIQKMNYLANVLRESGRMYPITIGNGRVLEKDVVLSGYKVPAGTNACSMGTAICWDDQNFSKASEFIPERWERSRPLGPIHPYAALPFSTGTRMCIGKRIAEQEIYCLLTRVLCKYDISLDNGMEMKVRTNLINNPGIPLPFTLTPRAQQ